MWIIIHVVNKVSGPGHSMNMDAPKGRPRPNGLMERKTLQRNVHHTIMELTNSSEPIMDWETPSTNTKISLYGFPLSL